MDTKTLALDAIVVDPQIQIRVALDESAVARYMESFDDLPPITVVRAGDTRYLADGFHRVEAAKRLGRAEIAATLQEGSREDALRIAATANAKHGLPLRGVERNRAIVRLHEIAPQLSLRDIAQEMGCSHETVRRALTVTFVTADDADRGDIVSPSSTDTLAATLGLPGIATPTSLTLPEDLPYDEWLSVLRKLAPLMGSDRGNWWIGDAYNFGTAHYPPAAVDTIAPARTKRAVPDRDARLSEIADEIREADARTEEDVLAVVDAVPEDVRAGFLMWLADCGHAVYTMAPNADWTNPLATFFQLFLEYGGNYRGDALKGLIAARNEGFDVGEMEVADLVLRYELGQIQTAYEVLCMIIESEQGIALLPAWRALADRALGVQNRAAECGLRDACMAGRLIRDIPAGQRNQVLKMAGVSRAQAREWEKIAGLSDKTGGGS